MRNYSLEEVNARVPELTAIFTRVFKMRGQVRALYRKLDEQNFAPDGDDFEPEIPGAPEGVIRDRTLFKGMVEILRSDVAAVLDLGCMIKDLDAGLVDWYAESGTEPVLLCWKFGESEVGFFHGLEAGFAGRRPVSELKPPRTERLLQ
jgi:hypothetical protein